MITFEITEIINDILELEEHNRDRISLDAVEAALGVGSVNSKYPQFRNGLGNPKIAGLGPSKVIRNF